MGAVGGVVSILTVLAVPGELGVQAADVFPAPSTARICTSVVPSPEIAAGAGSAADQVVPPSVEVRYW